MTRNIVVEEQQRTRDIFSEKIDAIPGILKSMIMSNFTVNNAVPITRTDIESMFVENNKTLIETIRSIIPSSNNNESNNNSNDDNNNNDMINNNENYNNNIIVGDNQFLQFTWGGIMNRMVPEFFVFPSCPLHTIFTLYYHGNTNLGVRPYRLLGTDRYRGDLSGHKDNQTNFGRAETVINLLLDQAMLYHYIETKESVQTMSLIKTDELFSQAFPHLISTMYDASYNPERAYNNSYTTFTTRLSTLKKKLRDNNNDILDYQID